MGEMIRTAKRLQYANGYLDLGMVTDAAAELEAIEKGDQASYETMSMWVRLYSESRDWSKMAALAEQLVALDEKAAYGWVNWAYALRELERVADAKEVATRGLKKHAEEAVLWFNLACSCSLLEEDLAENYWAWYMGTPRLIFKLYMTFHKA